MAKDIEHHGELDVVAEARSHTVHVSRFVGPTHNGSCNNSVSCAVCRIVQDESSSKLRATSLGLTPDVITQMQRHYNPEEDIIGRAEFMPEIQFKVINVQHLATASAL